MTMRRMMMMMMDGSSSSLPLLRDDEEDDDDDDGSMMMMIVGSQIACRLAMLCSATMRVVSRDVIEHLSQTRVISSERRYRSVCDIPNRCGTLTIPVRRFCHVTAIPEVVPP
jgi:hypothetical protein